MRNVNTCTFVGNIVRDAELRATKGGSQYARFTLAVNETKKTGENSFEDQPNFLDFEIFGARVPKVVGYLTKGTKLCVTAAAHQDRWEGQDGQKRTRVIFRVNDFDFMSRRNDAPQQGAPRVDVGPVAAEDLPF